MWIFLGCALAARQWERVWQRAAHGESGARAGSTSPADGHMAAASWAPSAPNRPGNDHSGQKRARFWAELREGQREAGALFETPLGLTARPSRKGG